MVDLKDPKILAIGGVVLVGAFVLLKNKDGSAQPAASVDTGNMALSDMSGNAVGGAYTYLDGSGVQHIVATDPNGNLVSYGAPQPAFSSPSSGQLSTYSGYGGSLGNGTPWLYGGTPNYATIQWQQYLEGQGLSSTSTTQTE